MSAPPNISQTNPPPKKIDVSQNIKALIKHDMLGYETELQTPIPSHIENTIQQSINLTQQTINDETIPLTVKNLLQTPLHLETTVFVGLMISIDTFTSFLLFTPIRTIVYIYRVLFTEDNITHFKRIFDLLIFSIMIFVAIVIWQIDIGVVYHYVRAESVLKLYALYNALEMFNRLLSALSIDFQSSLLLSIKNKKIKDIILFYILSFILFLLHTTTLFFHTMALNVAINSKGYSLLVLLISNNILEIKGTVWKRMFPENAFQLICADIVEIFELFCFVILLSLCNFGSYEWDIISNPEMVSSLLSALGMILFAEVVVDSIKHSLVCKFNKIPLSVYDKARFVLLNDLLTTKEGPFKLPTLDSNTVSARRLGMPIVALSILLVRFSFSSIPPTLLSFTFIVVIITVVYFVKFIISVGLRQLAYFVVAEHYNRNDELVKQMKNIGRYLMEKGRIPP
ncbi:Protein TAPT1 [Entamoeba marina]